MKIIHDISLNGRGARCGGMAVTSLFPSDGKSLWIDAETSLAYQDTAGTIPATFGQNVARIDDLSPNGLNALQGTTTAQPLLGRAPVSAVDGGDIDQGDGPAFLRFDLVNTSLPHTLTSGLAGDLMVFGRRGSWISQNRTIASGGTLAIGPTSITADVQDVLLALGDIAGWVAVDKTLSTEEQAALIAHFRRHGAKGLLVPGANILTNGDFSNGATGWSLSGGWSMAGGIATHSGPSGSDLTQSGLLSADTSYLVTYDISAVRASSTIYARTGSSAYKIIAGGMTVGSHNLIIRTGATAPDGFTIRAGAGSDVDINSVSLRELRPSEDW